MPPSRLPGELWLRNDCQRVKPYSRPGNDPPYRSPLIVEAVAKLPRSGIVDGEAVSCDPRPKLGPN